MKKELNLNSRDSEVSKGLIEDISSKLNKKSKSKSLKANDTNSLNKNKMATDGFTPFKEKMFEEEFEQVLLYGDKNRISQVLKEKKTRKTNFVDNDEIKLVNKDISEVGVMLAELAGLFHKDKINAHQFNDKAAEDNVLNLIIENIDELITDHETKQGLNKKQSSQPTEFSSEYDILNPLSGLDAKELQEIGVEQKKQVSSQVEPKVSSQVEPKVELVNNFEVVKAVDPEKLLTTEIDITNTNTSSPQQLKYSLKDLISLIRQVVEKDNEGEKQHFEQRVNSFQYQDYSDEKNREYIHSKIEDFVKKNTKELVNTILPQQYFKSINKLNKPNSASEDKFKELFPNLKTGASVISTGDITHTIQEKDFSEIETKLNPLSYNNKNERANNISQPAQNPTDKLSSTNSEITKEVDLVKEKVSVEKNNTNINITAGSNLNNNIKADNLIRRSNNVEFQVFNDIQENELIQTTAKATALTPNNSTSMVRITMNPLSLGTVFVEIKLEDQKADINFKAINKDVVLTLQRNVLELKEALAKENVSINSLIIDFKDFSQELNPDGQNQQFREQEQKGQLQNKQLYKDLSDVDENEIIVGQNNTRSSKLKIDKNFYDNLKQYAGSIRGNSPIYKDVENRGSSLKTQKVRTQVVEKYQ